MTNSREGWPIHTAKQIIAVCVTHLWCITFSKLSMACRYSRVLCAREWYMLSFALQEIQ